MIPLNKKLNYMFKVYYKIYANLSLPFEYLRHNLTFIICANLNMNQKLFHNSRYSHKKYINLVQFTIRTI